MLHSMTGFATGQGTHEGLSWAWELRSVNGKGLDLRLRVPDWIEGLEAALRKRLAAALARGNVSLNLRVQSDQEGGGLMLNAAQLFETLSALAEVEAQAMARGITLAPAHAADILALRGIMEPGRSTAPEPALRAAIEADFETVLTSFLAMRATEGAALQGLITDQLKEIARLTDQAAARAEARLPETRKALTTALARVLDNSEGVDATRLSQELALLAVKADVTEEIDRLRAHVAAARDLLMTDGPVGRKLDFLSQEFNREANTLCAKSQDTELTTCGLALKTVIDQMREQVQNLE